MINKNIGFDDIENFISSYGYTEKVNLDFCRGFIVAKDIFIKMLMKQSPSVNEDISPDLISCIMQEYEDDWEFCK